MDFVYKKYKEITFPVRDCEFKYGDNTIRRLIGSEEMSAMFFKENGSWTDDDAERIDSEIAYYLPRDELITLSDQQIFDYIFYHIDEGIIEDFDYV